MSNIQTKNLTVSLGENLVLNNITLDIAPNKITAIIGPNGSGKSTLLKSLSGLIKPKSGDILIGGQPIANYKRKQFAKKLSFLMQNPEGPDDITVSQLVSMGRYSHQGWMGLKSNDYAQIHWAIKQVDLEHHLNEPLANLSGGQRQRAWLAMALAQDSDSILLDEPTTFLDIRHQIETLSILRRLNSTAGKTIVIAMHDLQQMIQFADYLIIFDQGRMVYHDKVSSAMDFGIFEKVFGVKLNLFKNENNELMLTVKGLIAEYRISDK